MRIFRDSVTPSAIPLAGIDGVLGYANGPYAWPPAAFARFTSAGMQVARIDVSATGWELAAVLDVESGDAGPAQAPGWIGQRNAFRDDAVVYCGLDNCPALFAATARLSGSYWLLVASWDDSTAPPGITLPGNVRLLGKQYKNTADYDESVIYDDAWHRP